MFDVLFRWLVVFFLVWGAAGCASSGNVDCEWSSSITLDGDHGEDGGSD